MQAAAAAAAPAGDGLRQRGVEPADAGGDEVERPPRVFSTGRHANLIVNAYRQFDVFTAVGLIGVAAAVVALYATDALGLIDAKVAVGQLMLLFVQLACILSYTANITPAGSHPEHDAEDPRVAVMASAQFWFQCVVMSGLLVGTAVHLWTVWEVLVELHHGDMGFWIWVCGIIMPLLQVLILVFAWFVVPNGRNRQWNPYHAWLLPEMSEADKRAGHRLAKVPRIQVLVSLVPLEAMACLASWLSLAALTLLFRESRAGVADPLNQPWAQLINARVAMPFTLGTAGALALTVGLSFAMLAAYGKETVVEAAPRAIAVGSESRGAPNHGYVSKDFEFGSWMQWLLNRFHAAAVVGGLAALFFIGLSLAPFAATLFGMTFTFRTHLPSWMGVGAAAVALVAMSLYWWFPLDAEIPVAITPTREQMRLIRSETKATANQNASDLQNKHLLPLFATLGFAAIATAFVVVAEEITERSALSVVARIVFAAGSLLAVFIAAYVATTAEEKDDVNKNHGKRRANYMWLMCLQIIGLVSYMLVVAFIFSADQPNLPSWFEDVAAEVTVRCAATIMFIVAGLALTAGLLDAAEQSNTHYYDGRTDPFARTTDRPIAWLQLSPLRTALACFSAAMTAVLGAATVLYLFGAHHSAATDAQETALATLVGFGASLANNASVMGGMFLLFVLVAVEGRFRVRGVSDHRERRPAMRAVQPATRDPNNPAFVADGALASDDLESISGPVRRRAKPRDGGGAGGLRVLGGAGAIMAQAEF